MQWCLAHPYLTFAIILFLIYGVYLIVNNICDVFYNKSKVEQFKLMVESLVFSNEDILDAFYEK